MVFRNEFCKGLYQEASMRMRRPALGMRSEAPSRQCACGSPIANQDRYARDVDLSLRTRMMPVSIRKAGPKHCVTCILFWPDWCLASLLVAFTKWLGDFSCVMGSSLSCTLGPSGQSGRIPAALIRHRNVLGCGQGYPLVGGKCIQANIGQSQKPA
jgi:hypothetical protein